MSEKTNLQDLATSVAAKSGIAIKDVEYFLRELIETIQQALLSDESVRIKNLGTFKRLTVSARESVDVTTGNRVVIPAHYKINFIPDNNLAQAVNEPFALFDTIELDDAEKPGETKVTRVNEIYEPERRPETSRRKDDRKLTK
jgi:nucleoid DNA-binding protein